MDILLLDESQDRRAIDTFKIIDEKFKDAKRFFIMGSDNYANSRMGNNYMRISRGIYGDSANIAYKVSLF